jgi:hypothetical protein
MLLSYVFILVYAKIASIHSFIANASNESSAYHRFKYWNSGYISLSED